MNERLWNCSNCYQGKTKKVLCVCSAGLLRSPTVAHILSGPPWNYNTRAAGLDVYALIPVDQVLVTWADEIVVMEKDQKVELEASFDVGDTPVTVLGVDDIYEYRQPELVGRIKEVFSGNL